MVFLFEVDDDRRLFAAFRVFNVRGVFVPLILVVVNQITAMFFRDLIFHREKGQKFRWLYII